MSFGRMLDWIPAFAGMTMRHEGHVGVVWHLVALRIGGITHFC
jgi:hypothetical protein